MLRKIKNGRSEVIEDLRCWFPPEGRVEIMNEEGKRILHTIGVYKRHPNKTKQFWERIVPPIDFNDRHDKELKTGEIDPVCERFRRQEWYRRLYGFWFYNNGKATYVTGLHYFFLNYWYLGDEVEFPNYRDRDRRFFYFMQYVIEDDQCCGAVYVTKRREGKTAKGTCFLFEPISRSQKMFGGIQSKTEEDASTIVFQRGVVLPFTKLPDFFRPQFDTSGGKRPKKKLTFSASAQKGRGAVASFAAEELNSEIDFRASTATAYDGSKLGRYLGDEVFKTANLDISERHRVVRLCCTDDRGAYTGKMLYTSTVEEIEGSIKSYRNFWDSSNQNIRNANGRTKTGLYRYFLPAYEALQYDRFGMEDIEGNKSFYLAERDALKSDPHAYNSEIRKNPFNIEEAFRVSKNASIYDVVKINDQLSAVAPFEDDLLTSGDLVWTDGTDSSVRFIPQKNGKFRLYNGQTAFVANAEYASFAKKSGVYVPTNPSKFIMGVDPFDHITTVDSRRSNGSAYLYMKFNSMDPDNTGLPIMEYIYRDQHPKLFYEDVIKMAVFAGANVLYEDNKPGLRTYFEDRGYLPFLLHLPGRQQPGIPASFKTKQDLAETTKTYVLDSAHKIFFPRLLEDLRDFEIDDTQRYDAAMAFGWTLVGDKSYIFARNNLSPNSRKIDMKNIFR